LDRGHCGKMGCALLKLVAAIFYFYFYFTLLKRSLRCPYVVRFGLYIAYTYIS
jgi:hypothetical protein